MNDFSFADQKEFKARALLIGERIDLRALEWTERLSATPLTLAVKGGGIAVLFRYGVIVFFGVPPMEQVAFLNQVMLMVTQPYDRPEAEILEIRLDPQAREGMESNAVYLVDAAIERLQLVAEVLGRSVVLAQYESKITQSFDRIEPFAANLEFQGRLGRRARELLKHIGATLLSEHKMVGRVEVTDKPELLWDHPHLERLYIRLSDEFEILDRHSALERKMELLSRTAETALGLLQHRRSLRVEWYIVILIVLEILLTLYQLIFRGAGSG